MFHQLAFYAGKCKYFYKTAPHAKSFEKSQDIISRGDVLDLSEEINLREFLAVLIKYKTPSNAKIQINQSGALTVTWSDVG